MLNRNYFRNLLLLGACLAGYSLLSGCASPQIKPLSSYPIITESALVETYNKVAKENLDKKEHVAAYKNLAPTRNLKGIEKILGDCYSGINEDVLNAKIIDSFEAKEFELMYKELKNCKYNCDGIVQKVRRDIKFCEERRYPEQTDFMKVYSEDTVKLNRMLGDADGVEKSLIVWIKQNNNGHKVIADIMKYYSTFKAEGMKLGNFEREARERARIDSMLRVDVINFSECAWRIGVGLKDQDVMLMAWKAGKEFDKHRAKDWDERAVELNKLMKKK